MGKQTIYLLVLVNFFLVILGVALVKRRIFEKTKKHYNSKITALEKELQRTENDYMSLLNEKGYLGSGGDENDRTTIY